MKLRSSTPPETPKSVAQKDKSSPKPMSRPKTLAQKKTTTMKKKAPPKEKDEGKIPKKTITTRSYRSTLKPVIKLMKAIHGDITKEHKTEFEKTPFNLLFLMFYNKLVIEAHLQGLTEGITKVIDSYDQVKNVFKIGKKFVKLEAKDVTVIFGFPMKGKEVNPYSERRDGLARNCVFNAKYFDKKKSTITFSTIKRQIKKVVKEKGEEEDFVKLMILYMLGTFLINGSAGDNMQTNAVEIVEDYDIINYVSWPKTIVRHLKERIKKQAEKKTLRATGCVLLLLYWLAEHANIIEPIGGSEALVPRAARWELNKIASELQKKLPTLKEDEVSETFRVPLSEVEQNLLKADTVETEEELIRAEDNLSKEKAAERISKLKQTNLKLINRVKEVEHERDEAMESYIMLVAETEQKLAEKDKELRKARKEIRRLNGENDESEDEEDDEEEENQEGENQDNDPKEEKEQDRDDTEEERGGNGGGEANDGELEVGEKDSGTKEDEQINEATEPTQVSTASLLQIEEEEEKNGGTKEDEERIEAMEAAQVEGEGEQEDKQPDRGDEANEDGLEEQEQPAKRAEDERMITETEQVSAITSLLKLKEVVGNPVIEGGNDQPVEEITSTPFKSQTPPLSQTTPPVSHPSFRILSPTPPPPSQPTPSEIQKEEEEQKKEEEPEAVKTRSLVKKVKHRVDRIPKTFDKEKWVVEPDKKKQKVDVRGNAKGKKEVVEIDDDDDFMPVGKAKGKKKEEVEVGGKVFVPVNFDAMGVVTKMETWAHVKEQEKSLMLFYFECAKSSHITWKKGRITILGEMISHLMANKHIDTQIIEWYIEHLKTKHKPVAKFFSPGAMLYLAKHRGDPNVQKSDYVKEVEEAIANCDTLTDVLLFPFNSTKTAKSKDPYHYTLLAFEPDSKPMWKHYNSMKNRGHDRYLTEAKKLAQKLTVMMNKNRLSKCLDPLTEEEEQVESAQSPLQGQFPDCAMHVCKHMKRIGVSEMPIILEHEFSEKKTQRMRARIAYKIVKDEVYGK